MKGSNMADILIACATMKKEINQMLSKSTRPYKDVRWIESGLHNVSGKLHQVIQNELDRIDEAEHVVLAFGACGNAISELKIGNYKMIMPKVDDCISLMLGSYRRKKMILDYGMTYFVSYGWLHGETSIHEEYLSCVSKYGRETADMIYHDILGAYHYLGVLDTGVEDLNSLMSEAAPVAEDLHLSMMPLLTELDYLRDLINGPWDDDRFLCIEPYGMIDIDMLRIPVSA